MYLLDDRATSPNGPLADRPRMAVEVGKVGRSLSRSCPRRAVGTDAQQQRSNSCVAARGCMVQWRPSVLVGGVGIETEVEQQFHQVRSSPPLAALCGRSRPSD